ncbi:MAG: VanZ family protein [Erysipelothrix sp.]|nr:VanZ family protein [Erysipelothrix sp.]
MKLLKRPHPLSILATLIWVLFIFSFSLQNASDSSLASSRLAQWGLSLLDRSVPMHTITLQDMVVLVRKTAHVLNFSVLMMCLISLTHQRINKWVLASWMVCLSVAIMDETIQLFVPGRSGQLSDIVLDMSGATLILIIVWWVKERRKHGSKHL